MPILFYTELPPPTPDLYSTSLNPHSHPARCCCQLRFAGQAEEAQRGWWLAHGHPAGQEQSWDLSQVLPQAVLVALGEGQPYSRPNVFQASGPWGPWGPWGLWGPVLLLTTPVVCFSLLAACYLFNSAREKEGSPVVRDHAHILACSPTMCPCHLEIQNHDCLKRGKWQPHSAASFRGPCERCLMLWEVTLCQRNQEVGTTWAWLPP